MEYYGTDALGSIRVVFNQSGGVVGRTDYMPFGEEVFAPGPVPKERFTGQERDGEVGLDYFHHRMDTPRIGRFSSPDPLPGRRTNTQSWNAYAYALNNPLRFRDPTGRHTQPANPDTHCSQTAGAYWCPGQVIFNATYVPSDNPYDWGYQFGGEFKMAALDQQQQQRHRLAQQRAADPGRPLPTNAPSASSSNGRLLMAAAVVIGIPAEVAAAPVELTIGGAIVTVIAIDYIFNSDTEPPSRAYPGNDPTQSPGEGFEWRGKGPPGSSEGSWYNPFTDESLHPDISHPDPVGPHWDWKTPDGEFRIFPDGTIEPK